MKITVFGSGYVGLVTGTCFAQMGNHVVCVDVDAERVERLKKAECPLFEPGLPELLEQNVTEGRLKFTTNAAEAVAHGDVIFIGVGTPPEEDGSADLQYVLQVAKTIGDHLSAYTVIVNKSTVPVGTADKVQAAISDVLKSRGESIDFDVLSNPEFLKEGAAVSDCMRPDRIVVGSNSDRATELMRSLYAPFNRNHDKLMIMDVHSAELTKYAANAMLATKISFMNELSGIAEKVGADIEQVRLGIGSDQRIGFSFIYPGCGYGGSCFPKDVRALSKIATDAGCEGQMLAAVHDVNEHQKGVLLRKICEQFGDDLSGKTFAVWGLAFKPNTDDIRDAPARTFMEGVWAKGGAIRAYDPEAMGNIHSVYGERADLQLVDSAEAALEGCDALVVVTEWMRFRSPDFNMIKQTLKSPVIVDGRNLYDPEYLNSLGLRYLSVGRS